MNAMAPSWHHVQVGVAHDCIDYVLPFAYSARYQSLSGITVGLTVGPTELTLSALEEHRVDFVITDRAVAGAGSLSQETLYENRVLVIASPDHPLAAEKNLTLADLVGQRWVVLSNMVKLELYEAFQRQGLPLPDVALHPSSGALHGNIVAKSHFLGVHEMPTILALAEARASFAVLPVKDFFWNRPVFAVSLGAECLTPAAKRLIEDLKALATVEINLT
jgi:DNA-binding transcriptional LysR family regulator